MAKKFSKADLKTLNGTLNSFGMSASGQGDMVVEDFELLIKKFKSAAGYQGSGKLSPKLIGKIEKMLSLLEVKGLRNFSFNELLGLVLLARKINTKNKAIVKSSNFDPRVKSILAGRGGLFSLYNKIIGLHVDYLKDNKADFSEGAIPSPHPFRLFGGIPDGTRIMGISFGLPLPLLNLSSEENETSEEDDEALMREYKAQSKGIRRVNFLYAFFVTVVSFIAAVVSISGAGSGMVQIDGEPLMQAGDNGSILLLIQVVIVAKLWEWMEGLSISKFLEERKYRAKVETLNAQLKEKDTELNDLRAKLE